LVLDLMPLPNQAAAHMHTSASQIHNNHHDPYTTTTPHTRTASAPKQSAGGHGERSTFCVCSPLLQPRPHPYKALAAGTPRASCAEGMGQRVLSHECLVLTTAAWLLRFCLTRSPRPLSQHRYSDTGHPLPRTGLRRHAWWDELDQRGEAGCRGRDLQVCFSYTFQDRASAFLSQPLLPFSPLSLSVPSRSTRLHSDDGNVSWAPVVAAHGLRYPGLRKKKALQTFWDKTGRNMAPRKSVVDEVEKSMRRSRGTRWKHAGAGKARLGWFQLALPRSPSSGRMPEFGPPQINHQLVPNPYGIRAHTFPLPITTSH
jgi:hypothetical protein